MVKYRTYKALFQRNRRPGDIVFAWIFLGFSLFLLWHLPSQTAAPSGGKFVAQPRFWPAVSLGGMAFFAALHLLGSMVSERLEGRGREVLTWVRALEFAAWFIGYALAVPYLGYLPSTLIVVLLMLVRLGHARRATLAWGAVAAIAIVVLFRAVLQVKLPSGAIYDVLPDGLRQIMLIYL
ncbi:MAG: tripartite tricarboxylate transporter TctB family protein [Rhodobacteraceae bacterium]|nr:MAG: tripartite tricarboxylate transporter TctB family protein [Paracoccaceae bacterium]